MNRTWLDDEVQVNKLNAELKRHAIKDKAFNIMLSQWLHSHSKFRLKAQLAQYLIISSA